MKGVAVKNSGAQSYTLGAPGYRAPVRQQPCHLLFFIPTDYWGRSQGHS